MPCSRLIPSLSLIFFFSSRRRHTRSLCDWSSDVCSSDLQRHGWRGEVHDLGQPRRGHESERPESPPGRCRSPASFPARSEERRVGKECRYRGSPYHLKKKEEKKQKTLLLGMMDGC